jgi:urease accessory protein
MRANSWLTVIGLLLMVSLPAQAHTGIGTVHGLADGLLHPLIGIDHVTVMLAIGLWAAMRGGRALWLLPMTFLMAMGAGAGLQMIGYALTNAETWVALSVLATGLLVWRNAPMSSAMAVALTCVFAVGHGYVHAAELTIGADRSAYLSGFLLTTALLHGLGVAVGLAGAARMKMIRTGWGGLCAIVGVSLLLGG